MVHRTDHCSDNVFSHECIDRYVPCHVVSLHVVQATYLVLLVDVIFPELGLMLEYNGNNMFTLFDLPTHFPSICMEINCHNLMRKR